MTSDSSGWQSVDPAGTSFSTALPEAPRPGEVLVFASTVSGDDRAWATETVARMTREWAESVERLLLMDLDLQGPGIHHGLDAEAAEGAADVLLFGASVSRVAQPVDDGAFHFAPSGTPVADPRVILSNKRWERVIQGCREAGIPLVLHLPLGQPGAGTLLARADRVVRLGRAGEGGEEIIPEVEERVAATLTPPDGTEGAVVDIGELAPDVAVEKEAPSGAESVAEISEPPPEETGEAMVPAPSEEETAAVVDIADLAPDQPEVGMEAEVPGPGPVVDIADLAPDEPVGIARPPEEGIGIPEESLGVEDEPAGFPEEPSPEAEVGEEVVPFGPEVGEVQETAPAEPVTNIEDLAPDDEAREALEEAQEEAVAEARRESAFEEAASEIEEPRQEEIEAPPREEEEALAGRSEAPGPGPVVDIADLAPDEPVGIARPPEEGIGIPEESLGVEDEAAGFPEEPSPEAEVEEQVVPFGPETGEVEQVGPEGSEEGTEAGFTEDEFAAGMDAIDAAAARKPKGFEGFDLGELEELSDPTGRRGEEEELGTTEVEGVEGFEEAAAPEGEDEFETGQEFEGGEDFEGPEKPGDVERADALGVSREPTDPLEPMEPTEPVESGESEGIDEGREAEELTGLGDVEEFGELEGPAPVEGEEASASGFDSAAELDRGTETDREEPAVEGDEVAGFQEGEGVEDADEEEALGFGGFSGELDLVGTEGESGMEEELEEESEGVEEERFEDEPSTSEEAGGADLGDDLVTGPDFGQGAPDGEESWEEEPGAAGGPGEAAAVSGQEAAAGRGPMEEEWSEESGEGPERRRGAEGDRDREGREPIASGEEEPTRATGGTERPRRGDRTRGRPVRLLILAVLVVAGAVGAHWFGVVDVPGLDRVLATVLGPAGTGSAPTVETGGPQPVSPVQSQSLLVDVYRDAASAGDVALALQDRLPDRIFAVAPVQQDGDVIHRLLAGPANTPDQVAGLRETLSGVLTREDPSGWTSQGTSLAFVIDELPDMEAARARARAATGNGVFAYVLEVDYPDGSTAYRVYSGGYSSPDEARALQGILGQAGMDDVTFTERRGEAIE